MKINFYKKGGVKLVFLKRPEEYEGSGKEALVKHSSFKADNGEVYFLPYPEDSGKIFVGLQDDISLEDLRLAFFKVGNIMQTNKLTELEISMPLLSYCQRELLAATVEGLVQSRYSFSYKTENKEEIPEWTLNYTAGKAGREQVLRPIFNETLDMMEGVFLARDLVNETSNTMTPEKLANTAKEKLEKLGVKVSIYEEDYLEKNSFKAFLAVAKASVNRPRLIVMEYKGQGAPEEKTALVGKGLCYDSGGYSIKNPKGMAAMHCDMGGSATVIGAIYALAKNKSAANVVGVVCACENMIAGDAMRTGDVIGSLSGKTIEVVNTDAEGRLTLADAVYYASHYLKADRIIDLATLTGAALIILGESTTAAVTNNSDFYNEFASACDKVGESVWLLPNKKIYQDMNKASNVADLLNSPGPMAGTITAGLFVGEFLDGDLPWLHLDIAGTAYRGKAEAYLPERATGYHVKSLFRMFTNRQSCNH